MVRAIHDVKGIDMGNYLIRYKAEIDFDGRELSRAYLDKQDLNLLTEVSNNTFRVNYFSVVVCLGSEKNRKYRSTRRIYVKTWRGNCRYVGWRN